MDGGLVIEIIVGLESEFKPGYGRDRMGPELMPFELRAEQIGSTLVIGVEGEFLLSQKLRRCASIVKEATGLSSFVVDLSLCTRVDSAGMGELLMWYSIAAKAKQRLMLCGVRENVKQMLKMAKVDGILLVAEGRDAALLELGRGG